MTPTPSPTGPDPYDALGLEPRFDLADTEIERAYLSRVASAHPDAGAGAGGADPAALNEARVALLDPERRAGALLARLGGPSASDHKALPDGFLMEIMEVRTEIEGAIASGGEAEREKWERWADEQRAGFIAELTPMFARAGERVASGEDASDTLTEIRVRLNAWRYIERLIEQLDPDYDPGRADFGG